MIVSMTYVQLKPLHCDFLCSENRACQTDEWKAYFIVPVDTAKVAAAVFPYKLLSPPTSNKALFPYGFPTGKFPVLVTVGLQSDIRMNLLQLIQNLYQGSVYVPYVDRLNDGKTPFRFNVKSFLGGVNNNDVNSVVPGKSILKPNILSISDYAHYKKI